MPTLSIPATILALLLTSTAAFAQSYPISGRWTYEDPQAEGPAPDCGRRYMTFQGMQRFDTGGGVPSYRNVSVRDNGDDTYLIVDEFATGQISAWSNYTLRKIDNDHIVIDVAGKTIPLRRCQ